MAKNTAAVGENAGATEIQDLEPGAQTCKGSGGDCEEDLFGDFDEDPVADVEVAEEDDGMAISAFHLNESGD